MLHSTPMTLGQGLSASLPVDFFDRSFVSAKNLLEASGGAMESIPMPAQTVLLIGTAQGVLDNGGLRYFFESDFPGRPSYETFADAYARIGAQQCADAIRQAAARFPFSDPHLRRAERCDQLDVWSSIPESPLDALDDVLLRSGGVWALLDRYLEDHLDELQQS